jgi:hypothetical protein
MHRTIILLFAVGLLLTPIFVEAQSYLEPLNVKGFEAHAVAFQAKQATPQEAVATRLGVEIQVQVVNYLPRALEPMLIIDGVPVPTRSRVVNVEGDVTTLGFLVDSPTSLKDGASLAIQMGDEVRTRSRVPETLELDAIKPLEGVEAQRLGLPDLKTWLRPSGR